MRKARLSLCIIATFILIGISSFNGATPTTAAPNYRLIAYEPSWAGNVNDIQITKLTHVNYAFLLPNSNGSLQAIENPSKLQSLVTRAHANGVKVLISVGGWNNGDDSAFESFAASSGGRTTFTNNIINFVNQYNLDGVDIDWEYPDSGASANNYAALMSQLSTEMHNRGKLLTAAVVAVNGGSILNSVFGYVDFLNLMAYDGDDGAGHSPYSLAVNSINYWKGRGLPASKTVLGVPFYAHPSWAEYSTLLNAGCSPDSDTCFYQGATNYYNGRPTIRQKTTLAIQQASGIMYWEDSQDVRDGRSLHSAIYEIMQNGTTPTNTPVPGPWNGTPAPIPGTVQVENFDTGGQGVSYNDIDATNNGGQYRPGEGVDIEATTDTGGGYNVGYTATGEWLKYTVNIQATGMYSLGFRVASTGTGGTFHLEVDGANVTGTLTVPNTGGWQAWATVTKTGVNLTAGQRTLRLVIDNVGGNFNSISFTTSGVPTTIPTFVPPTTIPPTSTIPINPSAWYQVINQGNGKCVDATDGGTTNGTLVQQWACTANNQNQQWQFRPTSGGYYQVVNRHASTLVWDVANVSTADNAAVHLWAYVGGNNQQWQPVSMGGGFYKFVNRNSGKCLDVPAASAADATKLVQYTCNGTGAQSFSLTQQP